MIERICKSKPNMKQLESTLKRIVHHAVTTQKRNLICTPVPEDEKKTPNFLSFRHFNDKTEASSWGDHYFNAWRTSLSSDQIHAIRSYTLFKHNSINQFLRFGMGTQHSIAINKQMVQQIQQSLYRTRLPEDIIVYRRIPNSVFPDFSFKKPESFIGRTFLDRGFLSTTLTVDSIENFYPNASFLLKIYAPKGARGAYLGPISLFKEAEVLFDRNQTLLVDRVGIKQHTGIMICRLVPNFTGTRF